MYRTRWCADRGTKSWWFLHARVGYIRTETNMSFCEHCQGQRFDRARVLQALRDERRRLRRSGKSKSAEDVLARAIETIRRLEIPHLDVEDDDVTGASVH